MPEALALIARAAEGSVRDALSLFDQAIAHAAGPVRAEDVRGMLGLADRTRVIDLFEALMRADIARALSELRDQYDTGADPAMVLGDLAEFTHFVTRLKIVPALADDVSLTEAERTRGRAFAAKLSMRVLARTWQMLLKGIAEVEAAGRPLAAAEMVLVRIAYAADLPTPDEVIRSLGDSGARQWRRRRDSWAGFRRCRGCAAFGDAHASGAARDAACRAGSGGAGCDQRAARRGVELTGPRAQQLHGAGRARRRKARPGDQERAGTRCAARPFRGWQARNRARRKRAENAGRRAVEEAERLDRAALDGRRLRRGGRTQPCGRRRKHARPS